MNMPSSKQLFEEAEAELRNAIEMKEAAKTEVAFKNETLGEADYSDSEYVRLYKLAERVAWKENYERKRNTQI